MGKKGRQHTTDKSELEQRRETDRTFGLIALGASEEVETGSCPSSEELARFIEQEKKGGTGESELLEHISNCEKCYEEWVTLAAPLKRDAGKGGPGKLYRLFSNPRYLAAVGSGLAVAASIMVFLSISPKQLRDSTVLRNEVPEGRLPMIAMEQPSPEQASSLDYDDAEPEFDAQEGARGSYEQPLPPTAPPFAKKTAKSEALSSMREEATLEMSRGGAGKNIVHKRKAAAPGKPAEKAGSGYLQFVEQVNVFCREKESAERPAAGGSLLKKGKALLAMPEVLTPVQVQVITGVIEVLDESADSDGRELCDRLMDVLQGQQNQ